MRTKKRAIIGLILSGVFLSVPVRAEPSASTRANIFKEVIEAIGAAGDALVKITDGIAHLIKTGNTGWEYVSAKKTYSDLLDISQIASHLAYVANPSAVTSIDEYLKKKNPTQKDWDIVQHEIDTAIDGVRRLLNKLEHKQSDFIREDAYAKLLETIEMRGGMLNKLSMFPPPRTSEEKADLRQVNEKYKRLIANLRSTIRELNAYLKVTKPR